MKSYSAPTGALTPPVCRCEFIRTRPNEFGPTAWIRRRDMNGYHYLIMSVIQQRRNQD